MVNETLTADPNFKKIGNLFYQDGFKLTEFESAYVDIRKKEGRIFTDSEVQFLPEISADHPLSQEWRIRSRSSRRLVQYLSAWPEVKVIEVGCGNGWLSNRISQISGAQVVGVDVNETELKQASSVFKDKPNLAFILGDIHSIALPCKFDVVVFASSLQYFANIETLVDKSFELVDERGEIHILDTPIYENGDVASAKRRSSDYFSSQHSTMHDHYFHHTWQDLQKYRPTLMYNPRSIFNKLAHTVTKGSPFPWIKIKKVDNV
jgi:SAM-dependent methyltransferase